MTEYVTAKFDSASNVNLFTYSADVGGVIFEQSPFSGVNPSIAANSGKVVESTGEVCFARSKTHAAGTGAMRTKLKGKNLGSNGILIAEVAVGDNDEMLGIQVGVSATQVLRWGVGGSGNPTVLSNRTDLGRAIGTAYTCEAIYDPATNNLKAYLDGTLIFDADAGSHQTGNSPNYRRCGLTMRNAEAEWYSNATPGTADAESTDSAPAVITHPSNVTRQEGQSATFTAAFSGAPTPTVQWQRNTGSGWANISGETTATLVVPAVTLGLSGYQYRCVGTNTLGSATTNAATLTVTALPGVDLSASPDFKVTNTTTSSFPLTTFDLVFYDASTDAFVVKLSKTTNASALFGVVKDAALTAGKTYNILVRNNATGDKGLFTATAA